MTRSSSWRPRPASRRTPSSGVYDDVLGFNQRNPMLARRDVRQALSEAVDRQQIIDLALKKRGSLAKGPFWPYHWALPGERALLQIRCGSGAAPSRRRRPDRPPLRCAGTDAEPVPVQLPRH